MTRVTANGRLFPIAGAISSGRGRWRGLLKAYRGHEIVASPWNVHDVAIAALAVAESSAQGADLNLQICFFHECLRPDTRYQCLLGDHFAGPFNQSGEDVESTTAEPHGLVTLEQEPSCCDEPERAERDRGSVHGEPPVPSFTYFT